MKIEELGIIALQKAFDVHEKLGDKGLKPVQKNSHGDTSLVGDIECEKVVIDTFREEKIPIRIISEEHGQVDITENPKYLAVLDGIDGTKEYKMNQGEGRYATMFAIFSNINPTYNDYIFCGVIEHSTNQLFFASKDKGSFVLVNGKQKSIHCSNIKSLKNSKIYADDEFDKNRNITFINDHFLSKLKGYKFLHEISSGVCYIDLASGKADLVLECTRKGNLEIATSYGLIKEAGGVMVGIDSISLGNRKYLEFGQNGYLPVISASTVELAKELLEKI
jgi:fructose-1,6-bisphosphatase/inositol monophosphatase family enzyme